MGQTAGPELSILRPDAGLVIYMRHSFILFAILFGCISVEAQQVPDLTGLSIEDLTHTTLSTASRHLEDPRKAPARVAVITRERIIRYGWRTVGEMLRSLPELYTSYDRTYTYIGVRGFLQSGDYNARVLFMIDGHRMNENIYDSGLIGTEFPLDVNLIDHVEVVYGPGSSMFGTNAELAVVNVITRQPENRSALELESENGSTLSRMGEISGFLRTSGISGVISGSLFRSNGAPRLYFPSFDSPETNSGFADNLDGDRFDHAFAAIRHGGFRWEGVWGSRTKIVPNASYATNFDDAGNRSIDTRGYLDVAYTRPLGSSTDLDVRGYYDAYRYYGSFPYGGTNSPDRTIQINDAFADWLGLEAVVSHTIGEYRFVGGMTGEYNLRVLQRNYYLGQPPFLNDRRHPDFLAEFGEVELNPTSWISFNLGGRIDQYNTFGVAASPRVAVMLLPGSRTSIKYLLGGAFRAPDPYDQYYVDQIDIDTPSRNLQPEKTQSQSVLINRALSDSVHVDGEFFHNNLENTIEETADPVTGLTHFANSPGLRSNGINIALDAKTRSGWAATGSYTASRAKSKSTNNPVINSPNNLAKFKGIVPLRYASLAPEFLFTGPQTSYLGTRVASSFLTNVTVSASEARTGWEFSASCYNLFDRRWATPTGPEISDPATVQDGRTWRLRLQYRYTLPRQRR